MPTTLDIPEILQPLAKYLNGLESRASVAKLRELLTGSDVTYEDVAPFAEFSEMGYTRKLICEGPWYHMLVLSWRSGQRSPIHNHAESTCGLKILKGIATETIFEETPSSQIKPITSIDLAEGLVCASQDADTHQVSNVQAPGQDLVTLHIYSPPLIRMDQFSITGTPVQPYVPSMGYADGGGI